MKYAKQPLPIIRQISKLKSRGLLFDDEELAAYYLANISYYRLRAYTFPFQDNYNEANDHCFLRNDIRFGDITDLYNFDSRLRSLIFSAIEKIEISLRTKIVYEYSIETKDSHWFLIKNMYHYPDNYDFII
jgi:abortive infection bacteriophage resistance protein